jgi:hypothetical protein
VVYLPRLTRIRVCATLLSDRRMVFVPMRTMFGSEVHEVLHYTCTCMDSRSTGSALCCALSHKCVCIVTPADASRIDSRAMVGACCYSHEGEE